MSTSSPLTCPLFLALSLDPASAVNSSDPETKSGSQRGLLRKNLTEEYPTLPRFNVRRRLDTPPMRKKLISNARPEGGSEIRG